MTALVWFRQDLRCRDNVALASACHLHEKVFAIYILDEKSMFIGSAQKWWLHHSLISLQKNLKKYGVNLLLRRGDAFSQLKEIVATYGITHVYWNRCYEPLSIERDKNIKSKFEAEGIRVQSSNGSLLHEPWTIKNKQGEYFKVFTPYWNHCLSHLTIPAATMMTKKINFTPVLENTSVEEWGLLPSSPDWASEFKHSWQPGEEGACRKLELFIASHLRGYKELRNVPALGATSKLSPHLHFGELSPWQIIRALEQIKYDKSIDVASTNHFLSELGWREFSYYLLYHYPELPYKAFRKEFNHFQWEHHSVFLKKWQQGLTGLPIIDAGMRELWRTGYMHNRVRMIVASFLTKNLLVDWREGASWFLDTLLDADIANNSASWQWVAGSGADAAPYFRIFNPTLQSEKFDNKGDYIRQWVLELRDISDKWIHTPWLSSAKSQYPAPIIDLSSSRARALERYKLMKMARQKDE